jgi:hypothetical protein
LVTALPSIDDLANDLRREVPTLEKFNRYYNGTQPLSYMQPELLRELGDRIRPMVINWPGLVVRSLEERQDVEGFRLDGETDRQAWDWWQANDMDVLSHLAHVDALVMGRAYVIVGANPDDPSIPLYTVESPLQVYAERDPATRKVIAAVKVWVDDDLREFRTLYLPDRTEHYGAGEYGWEEVAETDFHGMGVVPVVPIVANPRTLAPDGRSELADIVPISDAACKIATDMMISAEFHAIPRVVTLGLTEEDFKDAAGNRVSKWRQIAGRIWSAAAPPGEADVRQLPEADLRNFHETINALAKLAASMSGLPPHYFGWSDANPVSAEGNRAADTSLIKRAARRNREFGIGWEQVTRLGYRVTTGAFPAGASRMETVWADPGTPTTAQTVDALAKLVSVGVPLQLLLDRIPDVSAAQAERWRSDIEDMATADAKRQSLAFGMTVDGQSGPTDVPVPDDAQAA